MHACGRTFGRRPRAVFRAPGAGRRGHGRGSVPPLPYHETAVHRGGLLANRAWRIALDLPERPLVLGGCCCAHFGAVEALARDHGRIASCGSPRHGDLNTIDSSLGQRGATRCECCSTSGANEAQDVVLVGARNLDPPRKSSSPMNGIAMGGRPLEGRSRAPRGVRRGRLRPLGRTTKGAVHARAGGSRSPRQRGAVSVRAGNRVLGRPDRDVPTSGNLARRRGSPLLSACRRD